MIFRASSIDKVNVNTTDPIYDVVGNKVRALEKGTEDAGSHIIHWNTKDDAGLNVASGVYFCQFEINDIIRTAKILYLK